LARETGAELSDAALRWMMIEGKTPLLTKCRHESFMVDVLELLILSIAYSPSPTFPNHPPSPRVE
jgi:hypothetical protein